MPPDLLLGNQHKGAESEINEPVDHDTLAEQLIDLLRRQPDRTYTLAEVGLAAKTLDQVRALFINLVLGYCSSRYPRRLLRDQPLINHHIQLLGEEIRPDWTRRTRRFRIHRNTPQQIDTADDVIVYQREYLIDNLLSVRHRSKRYGETNH
jgi:hypothetical protein